MLWIGLQMKEYRKTYAPLILWCLALILVMLGAVKTAVWLGWGDGETVALMLAAVPIMLIALLWMIRKGEFVYWLSGGPSFDEAEKIDSAERREYSRKHLAPMQKGCWIALALLVAECFLGAHALVMVLSVGICIIAEAFFTLRIRWEAHEDDSEN